MHGCGWRAGSAAIAISLGISLCIVSAGAIAADRIAQFAQNVPDAGQGAAEPGQSPVAGPPTPLRITRPR